MVWNNFPVPEYKIVFMLAPKAGNSSIKAALKKGLGLSDAPDDLQRGWQYISPCEAQRYDWPKIAVVRNPYDRLVSCWWQKMHRHGASQLRKYGFTNGMTFEAFVKQCCKWKDKDVDQHVRSQVYSLKCKGEMVPDVICRCETLNQDWRRIKEMYRLDVPDLERRNPSDHKPYREYYTPEIRQMVEQRYGEDIERLEYAF